MRHLQGYLANEVEEVGIRGRGKDKGFFVDRGRMYKKKGKMGTGWQKQWLGLLERKVFEFKSLGAGYEINSIIY